MSVMVATFQQLFHPHPCCISLQVNVTVRNVKFSLPCAEGDQYIKWLALASAHVYARQVMMEPTRSTHIRKIASCKQNRDHTDMCLNMCRSTFTMPDYA